MASPQVHESKPLGQVPSTPTTEELLVAERRRVVLLQQVVEIQAAEIANLRSGQEARA